MATNIQSQSHTELKSYLEERLHSHFPAANNQEIAHAVEVAMGRWGYSLHHENDQYGQQDQHSQSTRQGQQDQSARQSQPDQNGRQGQYDQSTRQGQQDQNARQGQPDQNGRQGQQDQHSQNDQRGQQNRDQLVRDNNQVSAAHQSIASVRDAAIYAAQSISESSLRMAAVAGAWASYAATCAQAEQLNQNQQRAARN